MFDVKITKRTYKVGHADIKVYFNRYRPYGACLLVSNERKRNFDTRHYKYTVKILQEFKDDTCEIKLIKSYVDNDQINGLVGKKTIVNKEDINFKI